MSNTELVTVPETSNAFSLTRFMPRDLTELVKFAGYAARSGVFGAMTDNQALIVMLQGAELGINPLQSLREIPLVNGKPRPSATLVAGLIQRSPLCEDWHISSSPTNCTITAKRKGRGSEFIVNIRIEDVPASLKSHQVWRDNPEDMLVARAIHRMARRAFADILAGIQDPDEIDETRVIDVAHVERQIQHEGAYDKPHRVNQDDDEVSCPGSVWLIANKNGGAFLACDSCTATFSPPQEVRDAVRGVPPHLTLAGAAEPVLEPGERLVESEPIVLDSVPLPMPEGLTLRQTVSTAPVSAVQSESSAIIDEVIPASAETAPMPTPEPANPEDSAKERHQAMRNAIYGHWSMPRPTANKIEMRTMLEGFGWTNGDTLGDWLLGLDELTLASIADAIVSIR